MKAILNVVTNRYFLVTVFFLSWILFFASNDLVTQYNQGKELREMKSKLNYLETEIVNMKKQTVALQTDSAAIEKYAREKYHMKKANETIFVFDTIRRKGD